MKSQEQDIRSQDKAALIGRSGCLALAYIKLALILGKMDTLDPLALLVIHYDELVQKGIMDPDCYINDAAAFIKATTGFEAGVEKPTDYSGTGPIIAYNNKHFVIIDGNDQNIIWNSMDNDNDWLRLPVKSYRKVVLKQ